MRIAQHIMRRVLPAALTALPMMGLAEVTARIDVADGDVILSGLSDHARDALLDDPRSLRVQITGSASERGMLLNLSAQGDALRITPRFPLQRGASYDIAIPSLGFSAELLIAQDEGNVPSLTGFAPSQAVIPSNTLRLYLTFSEPVAMGQVRSALKLTRADGTEVASPFLNLETELWDRSQTRLTLLFDPGRIKQGVGPNVSGGAPLVSGEAYRLIVSAGMESAGGIPLASDTVITFRVGDAEHEQIDPQAWQIQPPVTVSEPLSISFDRIMDQGAVLRMIQVLDAMGHPVEGRMTSDGGGWSFAPSSTWSPGHYQIVVAPELEDVAGNTIGAAFDAPSGTMGAATEPHRIPIRILSDDASQTKKD